MLKRTPIAILLSYLCAGMALAGGYTRGGGARRPVVYFPLSISGTVHPDDLAAATACWNFDSAVGANYTDDCAGLYTMTVNGAPTLVTGDGTWPNGLSGAAGKSWEMNGGYLSRADDGSFDMDLTNNPGGDFSVRCVVTPDTVAAGTDRIISKYLGVGNQRGWVIYRDGAVLRFYISDDGTSGAGAFTILSATGFAAHRPAFITATYNWVTDGTSEMRLYVDNNATAATNIANGPVFDVTADFVIGGVDGGFELWDGLISDCIVSKGVVTTEAQHDQMFAQWQGRLSTSGNPVTITSASPPAIQQKPCATEDGCFIDQPSNSGAVGVHGEFSSTALNSKWWRGSCETCAAAGPRMHCTGWAMLENQGAGAATVVIDCDATRSAHGGTSLEFIADNGAMPKNGRAYSACQVNWINQDVLALFRGITTTGTANCQLIMEEHDDATCTGTIAQTSVWGLADPGATWTELRGPFAGGAWNGATASWRYMIRCYATGTAYTVNFDAAMALQAPMTFATDASCTSDADADAVCTATIPSITSPFSANGAMTVEGTWRSPWAGVDLSASTYLLTDGNPSAANSYALYVSSGTDEPIFSVYDAATAIRYVAPDVLNWAADIDYTLKFRTGGNDDPGLFWNSVWNTTVAGAGTGTRSAAQTTTYIGSSNTTPANIWTKELYIYPRTRF